MWSIQPKNNDYQIVVFKQTDDVFEQISMQTLKVGTDMKPNLLKISESGVFAILSLSDHHYKNGEVWFL